MNFRSLQRRRPKIEKLINFVCVKIQEQWKEGKSRSLEILVCLQSYKYFNYNRGYNDDYDDAWHDREFDNEFDCGYCSDHDENGW